MKNDSLISGKTILLTGAAGKFGAFLGCADVAAGVQICLKNDRFNDRLFIAGRVEGPIALDHTEHDFFNRSCCGRR